MLIFNKKYLFVSFTLFIICSIIPVISPAPQNFLGEIYSTSKKDVQIGYVSYSDTTTSITNFVKQNYNNVKMVQVKNDNKMQSINILIINQKEYALIRTLSSFDRIYSRIKGGLLFLLLLEEDEIFVSEDKKEIFNVSLNIETGEMFFNLISTTTQITEFNYHIYANFYDINQCEIKLRYKGLNYESYLSHIMQYLVRMINVINYNNSIKSSLSTASGGDWIKKTELIGQMDYGTYQVYSRYEIYKCVYTDVALSPPRDYYRIDSFVHHAIPNFIWSIWLVGPFVGQRKNYIDAKYGSQELYRYEPTGTIGTTTLSYNVNLDITISQDPSTSVSVGYSKQWQQPEVVITDQSSMINHYSRWIETFSIPGFWEYFWWPIMDLCVKPCLVSRTSFYSEPSIVVRVPSGSGLQLPILQSQYTFHLDHSFGEFLGFTVWTRETWTVSEHTTWNNVIVDVSPPPPPPPGGGCPILSVYDGEQYVNEGLLNNHAYEDITIQHKLINLPTPVEGKYILRLTEHHKTISHIDQIQCIVILKNGKRMLLPLLSAIHSTEGDIKSKILLSDDIRVDIVGADHNNGISDYIDLSFLALDGFKVQDIVLMIEGYNSIVK